MKPISEEDFKKQMIEDRKLGHLEDVRENDYDFDFPKDKID